VFFALIVTRSFLIASFADLGVPQDICSALASKGIIDAFPIQELTLPLAMAGQDLIGQAKTGTGKTLGFGIPLLTQVISPTNPEWANFKHAGKPQGLVIVPTRELAIQVAADLETAGKNMGARVLSLYGGKAYEPQVEALKNGVEVIAGTPGRLIDMIKQGHLDLSAIKVLVLDEADEMLDMGFLPDVETLVSKTPASRQTMLFSATMPGQIVALARRYMTQPTHIRASDPTSDSSIVDAIEQHVWRCHQMDKPELVARVLQAEGRGLTMIFCRTKRVAGNLAEDLANRGFASAAVHGDLGQGAREQALRAFRSGKVDVLVATDVAARGIDVADVTHVINYECPDDEKTYLHRVGRTGRAGASGVAITLVDWQDINRWQMINRMLGLAFNDPIETYSSSEHVYVGLGIPAGTTGVLPGSERTREGLAGEKLEDLGETGANAGRRGNSSKPQGNRAGSSRTGSSRSSSGRAGSTGSQGSRNSSSAPRKSSGGSSATANTASNGETSAPRERTPRARNRTRSSQKDA
jgi:superfamily II DNA/RNA helicase